MDIETAPVADREGDAECEVDGCDGTYVLYDNDRVCRRCGHISGTGGDDTDMTYRDRARPDEWVRFDRERENYSGFYGEDRIKFVGGFVGAYDFGPDFGLEDDGLL